MQQYADDVEGRTASTPNGPTSSAKTDQGTDTPKAAANDNGTTSSAPPPSQTAGGGDSSFLDRIKGLIGF